jgi:hypothetical protein
MPDTLAFAQKQARSQCKLRPIAWDEKQARFGGPKALLLLIGGGYDPLALWPRLDVSADLF